MSAASSSGGGGSGGLPAAHGGALTAADIVALLDLAPHPEGGYYRETFRDTAEAASGRAVSTAIYFLLAEGEVSRWHRVDAVEVWHWYAGAALMLEIADGAAQMPGAAGAPRAAARKQVRLGPDLVAGERPQGIVPAGAWQQARSLGGWTLVGCTVAPGFEFSGFELAPAGWEPKGAHPDELA